MSLRRLAQIGPLVVLLPALPACGYSARMGPQLTAARGDLALQGSGTLAGGFTSTSPQTLIAIPLTVAAGSRLDGNGNLTMIETGVEYSSAIGNDPLGFRFGPRIGGITSAPGGGYLGVKGGPSIALEERHGTQSVWNLNIEGFVNAGTGTPAIHTYGVCLSIGSDYYSSFRVPSGRPFRSGDDAIIAAGTRRNGAWSTGALRAKPDLSALDDVNRAREGARWLEDARMEHASIATFAKLAIDLLALGAPPALVDEAHRAAREETKHARLCYAVASAYLGVDVGPDRLPVADASRAAPTFERLAVESLVDGCYGEALAAELARARAREAKDPVIARVLRVIARDEARHAALGWKIVAWCKDEGGPDVEAALDAATTRLPLAGPHSSDRLSATRTTRTASSRAGSARRNSRRRAPSRTA